MPSLKPYTPGMTVAHMHVPKSAGTSLHAALMATIQPERPHVGLGPMIFGDFKAFDSIPSSTRQMIFPRVEDWRADADYVGGHVDFDLLSARYPDAAYITFLREPISRVISNWLFWRGWPWPGENFWGDWGETIRHSRWTLKNFLQDTENAANTDNVAVRMLVGPKAISPSRFIASQERDRLLQQALDNLRRFAFVELIENPRAFEHLSQWLNKDCQDVSENVLHPLSTDLRCDLLQELNDETFAVLDRRTELDLEVWRTVARWANLEPETLRTQTLAKNMVRFTLLTH